MNAPHPYEHLTPDTILAAAETFGYRCNGGLLALNSYENRVYRIDTEDAGPIVGKFYRPNRWSNTEILEEHQFVQQLLELEIPAIAPLLNKEGTTLSEYNNFLFSIYPWQPGRTIELQIKEDRQLLGRYLGRIHRFGSTNPFQHRPHLTRQAYGIDAVEFLLENKFIPDYLNQPFQAITDQLLNIIASCDKLIENSSISIHGDCHLSNILWTDQGAHIVDFDDCRMGPAIQDIWMLLSGTRDEMQGQLIEIIEGYNQFYNFNPVELQLIEPLRTLRMLNYSAWLARRWHDPAFPHNFPWFNTQRYWEEQILFLREQLALLNEPPLELL